MASGSAAHARLPRPLQGVIVLAGGTGERLGGTSKAMLRAGERTLLEHTVQALEQIGHEGPIVVVSPEDLALPAPSMLRTSEDPPYGGPAAGIGAGLAAVPSAPIPAGGAAADAVVGICTVDAPLTPLLFPQLLRALIADPSADGAVPERADPTDPHSEPWRQFPQGVYRLAALRAQDWPRDSSVRRVFRRLTTVAVPDAEMMTLDVDTPADLARLTTLLARHR